MNEKLIQDIFELEQENMVPILKASGLEFQPAKLHENLEKDQKCITIYRKKQLVGLLRYTVDNSKDAMVWSIQLKDPRNNKIIFYSLLKKTISEFINDDVETITSMVQKGNNESLKMHKRLKFEIVDEYEKAIRFKSNLKNLKQLIFKREFNKWGGEDK